MSKLLKLATVAFTFAIAASMGTASAMESKTEQMIDAKADSIKKGVDSMLAAGLKEKVKYVESQVKSFCNAHQGTCTALELKLLKGEFNGTGYNQLKSELAGDWGMKAGSYTLAIKKKVKSRRGKAQ